MIRQLPNILTLLNLVSGILGIINVLQGDIEKSIYFVLAGGIFDFFDGFVARLVKSDGELGKQLDSLADLVTFGVLPSLYLFQRSVSFPEWTGYFTLLVAVFSAIRLAKFNIDNSQQYGFKGLPVPANAIMLTTLFYLEIPVLDTSEFIISLSILSSFLLVSPIPMLALKFESYAFGDNVAKYAFIAMTIVGFAVLGLNFIPVVIPTYIVVSIASSLASKKSIQS